MKTVMSLFHCKESVMKWCTPIEQEMKWNPEFLLLIWEWTSFNSFSFFYIATVKTFRNFFVQLFFLITQESKMWKNGCEAGWNFTLLYLRYFFFSSSLFLFKSGFLNYLWFISWKPRFSLRVLKSLKVILETSSKELFSFILKVIVNSLQPAINC